MESDKQKEKIAAGCRVLRSNSTTSEGVETVPLNKQNGRNNTPTLAEDDIENDELTVERKLQIIHEDKTMDTPNNDYLLKQLPMDMIGTGELHRKIKNLPKKRKLDEAASMGVMAINVELPEQVKEVSIVFYISIQITSIGRKLSVCCVALERSRIHGVVYKKKKNKARR